tara:strand:- start:778 stop:927 length:150 start_codon:yes stop_codon:yes gene_type:complete
VVVEVDILPGVMVLAGQVEEEMQAQQEQPILVRVVEQTLILVVKLVDQE